MRKAPAQLIPPGAMARMLRVTAKWLRQEAESGRIPHLKAGRTILFNAQAVQRLLLERASEEGAAHEP